MARVKPGKPFVVKEPKVLLVVVVLALIASVIGAKSFGTWLLEVAPVVLVCAALVLTRYPLTSLTYRTLTIAALMIALGAHYTYAEVPLGEWMRDWFGFERNHYDRIGHVMQGVVAALVTREVLLRHTRLRPGWWLLGVVTLCCLGIAGGFELVEGLAAALSGQAGVDYLGTQGDEFDAQKDMTCALAGAIAAQLALARVHDRQLARFGRAEQVKTRR